MSKPEQAEQVVLESSGAIVTLVLNRPEKSNALTVQMIESLIAGIDTVSASADVHCIVIRGAGDKAFCAGADLHEMQEIMKSPKQQERFAVLAAELFAKLRDCPQPVIAAINGVCIGGGLFLACSSDLRFCSQNSIFAVTAGKLKITLAKIFLETLTNVVGNSIVAELILEGREFNAEEAHSSGLVNRVFAVSDFDNEVYRVADQISRISPSVQRAHKKLIRQQ